MRKLSILVPLAVLAFLIAPKVTLADTNKTITTVDTPGTATDIIVANNYAYVADQVPALTVLDVTIPSAPVVVNTIALADTPTRLDISGSILYVAEPTSMLTFNLSNPVSPAITGMYARSGLVVTDVASDGTNAYVLGRYNGQPVIDIVDVTNPAAPSLRTSVNVNGSSDVTLAANFVYVSGGRTLDVINAYPIATVAGSYTDPSASASYKAVQINGSIAYINDDVLGMHAINIANPAAMTSTFESAQQFPGIGYGNSLAISNGYAFLTRSSGGLAIYDVTNSTPLFVDNYSGTSGTNGMTIANNIAYVTVGTAGVQLLDISHPDVVPPVATPIGNLNPVVTPGSKYVDPGITVDAGSTVVTSGKVDTSKVGRYVITYTVTDRAGNVTIVKRTVIVGPGVDKLTLKNNTYTMRVGSRNVLIRPFPGYRGVILGRRLTVDKKTNPWYVFIATDAMLRNQMVIYNASARVVYRVNLATISTKGLQVDIASNPATLSVFYAIAPKANSLSATIFNFNRAGYKLINKVTLASTRATLVMKWIRGYTNEYVLATHIKGKLDKPVVWRYHTTKKIFVKDTKFPISKLIWTTTTVGLK